MRSSGEIIDNVDPETARKRGLVPIPPELVNALRASTKKQRRAWYREQVQALSQAPEDAALRADERRVARNKRKKASQRRRP